MFVSFQTTNEDVGFWLFQQHGSKAWGSEAFTNILKDDFVYANESLRTLSEKADAPGNQNKLHRR